MSVKGIMTPFPEPLGCDSTVTEAARIMDAERLGAVPIVKDSRLCGIFTYRDLIARVLLARRSPDETRLEEVMTSGVDSLGVGASYADALRMMVERDYTYMPVLDEKERVIGMLPLRELLQHHIDSLANELESVTSYFSVDGPGGD